MICNAPFRQKRKKWFKTNLEAGNVKMVNMCLPSLMLQFKGFTSVLGCLNDCSVLNICKNIPKIFCLYSDQSSCTGIIF